MQLLKFLPHILKGPFTMTYSATLPPPVALFDLLPRLLFPVTESRVHVIFLTITQFKVNVKFVFLFVKGFLLRSVRFQL